ncbi:MAG: hypothetical protein H2049_13585 [Porphyrobacter sp.]|nr:hypothetical protein [Porphyrobacter sp.]
MNRINEASADPSPPYDPGQKLPAGPTPLLDPDGRQFVAEWQAHLDAGRIRGGIRRCPTRPARRCWPMSGW